MRPGARIQAAIEIVTEIFDHHRPASAALSDWGKSHRFAGSGDRSAIGTLVYDVLRQRLSLAARMDSDAPRALVLAAAPGAFAKSVDEIADVVDGSKHAPAAITDDEKQKLAKPDDEGLPAHVAGNFPEWLTASLQRAFGDRAREEGAAMAVRAPVDLRVNTLLSEREAVLQALEHFSPQPTQFSPIGIRIAPPVGAKRQANVEAEAAHGRGWFEVQDEASQIAALLVGAKATHNVLDLCAGAGGKTLALAAAMGNEGQLAAYDANKMQLRPIFERMRRAGADHIDVLSAGDDKALSKHKATFDRVLIDAPCTGTGTWRRRPDTKWRLKPKNIVQRQAEQKAVLKTAAGLLKPGGIMAYVTCSILPEENTDQVQAFLRDNPNFSVLPYQQHWSESLPGPAPQSADGEQDTLLLTPAQHATDGFFIALLRREA